MTIFENYSVENDELFSELALANAEYERYSAMYEMADMMINAMKAEAEAKVIVESGTEEDLAFLVKEAEAEVAENKKGVIAKVIEALKNFFGKIFSIFKKDEAVVNADSSDDDETVQVNKEDLDNISKLEKAADNLSAGWDKFRAGNISGLLDIAKVIAIPAVATGAVVGAGALVVKKRGEIKQLWNKLRAKGEALKAKFDQSADAAANSNSVDGGVKSIVDKTKAVIANIFGTAKNLKAALFKKKENNEASANEEKQPEDRKTVLKRNVAKSAKEAKAKGENPLKPQKSGKYRFMHGKRTGEFSDASDEDKEAVQKALGESATVEEAVEVLRDTLGDRYIIELADDGCIDLIERPSIMESAINSIFGYDVANERVLTENASGFERELNELSNLFEKL